MFEYLKNILSPETERLSKGGTGSTSGTASINKYRVATAALLIEVAKADGNFSEEERNRIIELMKKDFNLDDECVTELLELSEQKVKESISIYEFTSLINQNFNFEEKIELLKNLWRIIYEDGKLDSHEDRLIKIIGSTMNVEHKDIIAVKLFIKHEMDK